MTLKKLKEEASYILKYEDMSGIQETIIVADSEYKAEQKFLCEPPHSRLGKGKIISIRKS